MCTLNNPKCTFESHYQKYASGLEVGSEVGFKCKDGVFRVFVVEKIYKNTKKQTLKFKIHGYKPFIEMEWTDKVTSIRHHTD